MHCFKITCYSQDVPPSQERVREVLNDLSFIITKEKPVVTNPQEKESKTESDSQGKEDKDKTSPLWLYT